MGCGASSGAPSDNPNLGKRMSADPIACANGMIHIGSRVMTQWTKEEGGDNSWCNATVNAIFDDGQAFLRYDDGDKWTGNAGCMHLLNPPSAPTVVASPPVMEAYAEPVAVAQPTVVMEAQPAVQTAQVVAQPGVAEPVAVCVQGQTVG